MDNNIQNMFFEKNNLKKMNDAVLQRMNLSNSSPEQKRYIIEILIKNMKLIWQKIDKTKINETNFNTIFNQFNSFSFNNTIKELQEKIKPQNHEPSSLKFERDFLSTPQNPVQVPQRAQPTKQNTNNNSGQENGYNNNSINGPNSYYMEEAKKAQRLASQFEPEINSLFRPIAPTIPEEASFNNYNFNKGGQDIKKRLDDVKSFRDNETYISKKPNDSNIPDFLKPKSTSCRTDDDNNYNSNSNSNNQQNYQSNNQKNNQKSKQSNNDNFLLGVDNDSGDLMSINNYDIGITDETKYQEDNSSFSDRLSKLKNDRESVQVPKTKSKVNFEEEIFDDITPSNINELKKKTQNQQNEYSNNIEYPSNNSNNREYPSNNSNNREYPSNNNSNNREYPSNNNSNSNNREYPSNNNSNNREYPSNNNSNNREYPSNNRENSSNNRENSSNNRENSSNNRENSSNNREYPTNKENPTTNINDKERIKQLYFELIKQEETEKMKLLYKEKEELAKLESKELSKLEIIQKAQEEVYNKKKEKQFEKEKQEYIKIFNEMKKLNIKLLEEITILKSEPKKEEFENIKKEIAEEFEKLSQIKKENEEKILELNLKTKEYEKITKIKNFLLDVSSENSLTHYVYNFNPIENITGLKLDKYSIPHINYNIEDEINNMFEIEINDENKQIIIESGKYDTISLIKSLNNNNINLLFELDEITQKVKVSGESNFSILTSILSFDILGFTSSCSNNNSYKSDKCIDLRRDDKVYLYLNNIDNSSPFAILNHDGISTAEIKFENDIVLDKLEIVFKNSQGNLCNFHKLKHNLTFNLSTL
jgi:hypothetical protein